MEALMRPRRRMTADRCANITTYHRPLTGVTDGSWYSHLLCVTWLLTVLPILSVFFLENLSFTLAKARAKLLGLDLFYRECTSVLVSFILSLYVITSYLMNYQATFLNGIFYQSVIDFRLPEGQRYVLSVIMRDSNAFLVHIL